MTCRIHFYLLNDHYSQEYADEQNNGEPSEMNRKYLWEDEFAIKTKVTKVDARDYSTYPLQGKSGETPFTEEIADMRLFYLMDMDTPVAVVGCSEVLLDSYSIQEGEEEIVLEAYMKGEEPLANPVTGIYIASRYFPKKLISQE
ncbi:MAG: hypothetical protein NXI10_10235 [bacterium]|nr:hypothetical protein [bacterium]